MRSATARIAAVTVNVVFFMIVSLLDASDANRIEVLG